MSEVKQYYGIRIKVREVKHGQVVVLDIAIVDHHGTVLRDLGPADVMLGGYLDVQRLVTITL